MQINNQILNHAMKTTTLPNSETQARIQQLKLGVDWHAEPPPTRDVNRDSGPDRANGGPARGCVKTYFSTIPSICSFHQNSPCRKCDRYRISGRHFSHSLAIC